MNFWNFFGLASKNDILDIKKQLEDMKNLIGVSMTFFDNINTENNKLKENICEEFSTVKEKIIDFEDKSTKNQKIISDVIEDIKDKVLKSSVTNKKQLADLNIEIREIAKDTGQISSKVNDIESLISNNKVIKQISKEIKKSQNQLDMLNKDMNTIQEMIRVVWVNDILDTLENQIFKVKEN